MKNLYLLFIMLIPMSIWGQTAAFEGAEGFGKFASGGRGGVVYYVTSLSDDASQVGTLRWAVNQNTRRIILFKVSGTIQLKSQLKITKGNITMAGQSAPGDGICLTGHPVVVDADNVIIRYMRFRMGDENIVYADGADAFGGRKHSDVIIDHCSICWSTDECASFYENTNLTVQWCVISESLRLSTHSKGPHGYGGIWGGNKASFHHNLLAHHDSRTPRLGPGTTTQSNELVDMRNNVIYNWGGNGCYGAEAMNVNMINNYYKPGPATPTGSKRGRIIAIDKKTGLSSGDGFYPINDLWGTFFIDGNYIDSSTSTSSGDRNICNLATADNWSYGVYNQIGSKYGITSSQKSALKLSNPIYCEAVTTHTAENAYTKVLAYAGCSKSRDSYDARIIEETEKGISNYKGLSPYNGLGTVKYPAGTVIGSTTLLVETTINWKSTDHPKNGIIDSPYDIKPIDAPEGWTPLPTLLSSTAPIDSDNDGMPDDWESNNGLSANDYSDQNLYSLNSEFTNVEVYLNSLVRDITTSQNMQAATSSPEDLSQPDSSVKVFPNPSTSNIRIESDNMIKNIEIINMDGAVEYRCRVNSREHDMSVSVLNSGVYLVRITYANSSTTIKKMIKI